MRTGQPSISGPLVSIQLSEAHPPGDKNWIWGRGGGGDSGQAARGIGAEVKIWEPEKPSISSVCDITASCCTSFGSQTDRRW